MIAPRNIYHHRHFRWTEMASSPVAPPPFFSHARSLSSPPSLVALSVSAFRTARRPLDLCRPRRRCSLLPTKVYANLTVDIDVQSYYLPTWTEFEMGFKPVYWETSNGRPPASGESLTIFFNPSASKLLPNPEYGVGFNGGFNQPIMCGGEPRVMTRRARGSNCAPFYTIKINVPQHALTLEFSFTDGKDWDGPYKIKFEVPKKWRNQPMVFFNEGLSKELSAVGACENAIFPDSAYIEDRCVFPASLIHEGGKRCDLDIVPGCTDPENPFYNPLANVDDGSCPYISDGE